jgi:DNA-binding NtrC family response regulator
MNTLEILLIDDEASLLKLMGAYLEHRGYRVTGYSTGREALAALKAISGAYALVVVDLSLPDIPGVDLVSMIIGTYPKLPVLICSGSPFNVSNLPPHVRFLQKPFLPRMLAQEVELMVGPPPEKATGRAE